MASPAQVANDLALQARYFQKRDPLLAETMKACSRLIRRMLAGESVDGRTYQGVFTRMMNHAARYPISSETSIAKSLSRGFQVLQDVRAGI